MVHCKDILEEILLPFFWNPRTDLHEAVLLLAPRQDIKIHMVPVVVLQLLVGEVCAGDIVRVRVWNLEPVDIVEALLGVRMPGTKQTFSGVVRKAGTMAQAPISTRN